STTIRRRRTSRSSKRSRWRGTKSSRIPKGRVMNVRGMLRPGMRGYLVPLAAGVALTASAFLPWVIIGDYSRRGVPDVWALWIAGLGALAAVLAALSMI